MIDTVRRWQVKFLATLTKVTPFYPGCYASSLLLKFVAYATIMTLTVMNSMSVKVSNYLQIITMAAKVLVLALITGAGFYNLAIGNNVGLVDTFEGNTETLIYSQY